MMAACAKYTYEPLNSADNEIRLITLRAGDTGHTIVCSLSHFPLHDAPSYRALSYTWGNTADIRSILLNGQKVSVTANLEDALRAMQQVTEDSYFWIDALCINQDDLLE